MVTFSFVLNKNNSVLFAQVANGILLPAVTFFLILIANSKKVLGNYANSWKNNLILLFVFLITLVLGIKSIIKVMELI